MARPSRATQMKRSRERAKQEKQKEKRVERAIRKEQKRVDQDGQSSMGSDEDPDLAGIIPGPQPLRET